MGPKAGIETAQRQCEKLVHLRAILEGIRKGDAIDPDALRMSTPSMALDYCGPIQLKDGVRTTQKVIKGALLLLVRPLGGLFSEAESRTFQERTMQRLQHSNALCKRLSYLCSVDIATKEVAECLRNLPEPTHPKMCIERLLLSGHRPQLLPLLGQRHEVWSWEPNLDAWALDGSLERHRRSFPEPSKRRKRRFGIFPALEVFHRAADVAKMANCQLMPCGEAIAVMTSEMGQLGIVRRQCRRHNNELVSQEFATLFQRKSMKKQQDAYSCDRSTKQHHLNSCSQSSAGTQVIAAEELQSEQALLLPAGFKS